MKRTSARQKAQQLAQYFQKENPDYIYLKEVFRHLRTELEVEVPKSGHKRLPVVPSEAEIRRYYEVVWQARNVQDMLIIKTLLYTAIPSPKISENRAVEYHAFFIPSQKKAQKGPTAHARYNNHFTMFKPMHR